MKKDLSDQLDAVPDDLGETANDIFISDTL
jgi:hypothetical protein